MQAKAKLLLCQPLFSGFPPACFQTTVKHININNCPALISN
jgi:hypothetical protein